MNYATAREQNRIFWETTILPYLDFLKDELQYKLINRINGPDSELIIDFDISGVSALREDMDAKVDRTIKLYSEGHRSFVEAAQLSGWEIDEETIEGGAERWMPSTLVSPDTAGVVAEESPDAAKQSEEAEEKEGVLDSGDAAPETFNLKDAFDNDTPDESPWPLHLSTEDARSEYWKLYTVEEEDAIERLNKKTNRVMRDMFLAARKRIREIGGERDLSLAAEAPEGEQKETRQQVYTENEINRLIGLDVDEWGQTLADEMVPILAQLMVESSKAMAQEIGVGQGFLGVDDEFIVAFLREYPDFLSRGPAATVARDVSRMVLRVLLNSDIDGTGSLSKSIGLTIEELELALTEMLKVLPARVERVSKTETNTSHNAARIEQMRRGKVGSHIWLSSRDAQVRETHQLVDGEEVLVGELFSNGVIYPGQPGSAPAQETVNCRCTTIPVIR
jgi:SPP1 gp7 family putative phage head morphogenesis protein